MSMTRSECVESGQHGLLIRSGVYHEHAETEMQKHLQDRIKNLPSASPAVRSSMLAFTASVVVTR